MAETKKTVSFKKIEDLKEKLKVSDVVFEGMKAANGWKAGKQIEEAAFRTAFESFLNAPVDGRVMDEEAKG